MNIQNRRKLFSPVFLCFDTIVFYTDCILCTSVRLIKMYQIFFCLPRNKRGNFYLSLTKISVSGFVFLKKKSAKFVFLFVLLCDTYRCVFNREVRQGIFFCLLEKLSQTKPLTLRNEIQGLSIELRLCIKTQRQKYFGM
jgi:hypothetical protein